MTEVVESDRRLGVDRESLGPQRLFVVPNPKLVRGEHAQTGNDGDRQASYRECDVGRQAPTPPSPPAPQESSANEERPAQARDVGEPVRRQLPPELNDSGGWQQQREIAQP